jgi:trans-2-enoyl-CoA reductase
MAFIFFLWQDIVDEPNDSQQTDYNMYKKDLIKLLYAIG